MTDFSDKPRFRPIAYDFLDIRRVSRGYLCDSRCGDDLEKSRSGKEAEQKRIQNDKWQKGLGKIVCRVVPVRIAQLQRAIFLINVAVDRLSTILERNKSGIEADTNR